MIGSIKHLLKFAEKDDKSLKFCMPQLQKKIQVFKELIGELPEELKDTVDSITQRYKTLQEREQAQERRIENIRNILDSINMR